jgi:hypothetical protein
MSLFGTPKHVSPAVENNPAKADLRHEAEAWILAHPVDAARFLTYAREMAFHGQRRLSMKMLMERVRWDLARERSSVRVNNNWTPYIGRWLIKQDPALEPLIRFREVHW